MTGAPSFTDARIDNRTRQGIAAEVEAEGSSIGDAVRTVIAEEQQEAGVVTSLTVTTIAVLEAADYAALDPGPDADTLYIVTDDPAVYLGSTPIVAPPA
jgi:hypothetical protein